MITGMRGENNRKERIKAWEKELDRRRGIRTWNETRAQKYRPGKRMNTKLERGIQTWKKSFRPGRKIEIWKMECNNLRGNMCLRCERVINVRDKGEKECVDPEGNE